MLEHADGDLPPRWGELDGVGHEVADDLAEFVFVPPNAHALEVLHILLGDQHLDLDPRVLGLGMRGEMRERKLSKYTCVYCNVIK